MVLVANLRTLKSSPGPVEEAPCDRGFETRHLKLVIGADAIPGLGEGQ
jgi:hypothetical protein